MVLLYIYMFISVIHIYTTCTCILEIHVANLPGTSKCTYRALYIVCIPLSNLTAKCEHK